MTPTDDHAGSIPIQLVYEDDLDVWRNAQSDFVRNWASTNVFKGERNKLLVVPDAQGRPACVALGMGRRGAREEFSCWLAAGLPDRLPEGKYHLAKPCNRRPLRSLRSDGRTVSTGSSAIDATPLRVAQLRLPGAVDAAEIERLRGATSLARDLINTPANDMSPEALAHRRSMLHAAMARDTA